MTTLWKFLGQRAARASLAVLSFLTAVAVSGCLPTMETPETRFYVLDALAQDTQPVTGARGASPIVVDLTSVAIPQYLRRPQIVTRVSANRLVLSEFDNWGGSLEKNILRCMASNLSILLDTSDIHVSARRLPADVQARVEVEVIRQNVGLITGRPWKRNGACLVAIVTGCRCIQINATSEPLGSGCIEHGRCDVSVPGQLSNSLRKPLLRPLKVRASPLSP